MPTPILVFIVSLTRSHLHDDAPHHFTSLQVAMRFAHILQSVGAVEMRAKLAEIHERLDLAKYSGLPQPALVIGVRSAMPAPSMPSTLNSGGAIPNAYFGAPCCRS
jgi:hypothetical protein